MKRKIALAFAAALCLSSLSFCAGSAAEAEPASEAEAVSEEGQTEAAGQADEEQTDKAGEKLQEYQAEGVGAFWLPEGFEMETGTWEEPFKLNYVTFTRDDLSITLNHFTQEVYDETGTVMPEDLEEYCQRPGAQKDLPEGGAYEEDEYGDMIVSYTEDETDYTLVMIAGENSYGTAVVSYPEGTEDIENILFWLSKTVLRDESAE